jgi:UDP-glucose 4-epimerase
MTVETLTKIKGGRILITGGAGFIGSLVAGQLLDDNEVVVLDSMHRDALSSRPFSGHPNLDLIQGDILDVEIVKEVAQGCTHIVHCAAVAGIDTVIKSPVTTMRVNILGSANVLEAASSCKNIERVVCFSTSEIFGQRAFRSSEKDLAVTGSVGEARWTYAVSKLAEEHLALAYYTEKEMPVVVVRPFNVYGPGQVGEGAMRLFIERALREETIYIHGTGSQIRAWCYVDDMVNGVMLALTHSEAVGESFNIGNERAVTTIYGLANTIVRVTGSNSKIEFVEQTHADVELRIPQIEKAKDLLGFEAEVDLEEGIKRTAEWMENK